MKREDDLRAANSFEEEKAERGERECRRRSGGIISSEENWKPH